MKGSGPWERGQHGVLGQLDREFVCVKGDRDIKCQYWQQTREHIWFSQFFILSNILAKDCIA